MIPGRSPSGLRVAVLLVLLLCLPAAAGCTPSLDTAESEVRAVVEEQLDRLPP